MELLFGTCFPATALGKIHPFPSHYQCSSVANKRTLLWMLWKCWDSEIPIGHTTGPKNPGVLIRMCPEMATPIAGSFSSRKIEQKNMMGIIIHIPDANHGAGILTPT